MKRVTHRDIAKAIGTSQSTVSRALKKDPRIPLSTREKVRQAARQLGYRPDPMLSALMTYRTSNRHRGYLANLGWVTNYPTRDGWRAHERDAYFRGAVRQAIELGYQIEEFWLNEPGITQRRATQILFSRNIQGLLFIPQPRSRAHLNLNWNKFTAITFGRSLAKPRLHNIDNDHYSSMSILMRNLKRLGYRRIAFALLPRLHEANDRASTAAYWAFQNILPARQIPVFMEPVPWERRAFERWLKKYQPEVLVSFQAFLADWVRDMGIRIPQDMGFALTAKHQEFAPDISGIDENNELVGETAVNVLVQMINRGERGIPKIPISTFVEGTWVEGKTTRRVYLDGPKTIGPESRKAHT